MQNREEEWQGEGKGNGEGKYTLPGPEDSVWSHTAMGPPGTKFLKGSWGLERGSKSRAWGARDGRCCPRMVGPERRWRPDSAAHHQQLILAPCHPHPGSLSHRAGDTRADEGHGAGLPLRRQRVLSLEANKSCLGHPRRRTEKRDGSEERGQGAVTLTSALVQHLLSRAHYVQVYA